MKTENQGQEEEFTWIYNQGQQEKERPFTFFILASFEHHKKPIMPKTLPTYETKWRKQQKTYSDLSRFFQASISSCTAYLQIE